MCWIKGNTPEHEAEFYWITIKYATRIEICYYPVRYSAKSKRWFDCSGNELSSRVIIAYCPITKPKEYKTIENSLKGE